jgi:hypothetical protein
MDAGRIVEAASELPTTRFGILMDASSGLPTRPGPEQGLGFFCPFLHDHSGESPRYPKTPSYQARYTPAYTL